MNMGMEKLIRRDLLAFGGYSAATSPDTLDGKIDVETKDVVKLDANENPYGCSPRVQKALARFNRYNIYPDDGQERLRKMLAGYAGVGAEHIVAGNGSNQLIDLLLRLLISEGDEVINCTPTFGIYSFSTRLCAGRLVEVPRQADFSLDMVKTVSAITPRTKVIFIANPNNPTGTLTPRRDIEALLKTGVPVVVDEAYYEFSWETCTSLLKKYDNLVVLRTFSKWAGLAGLRIGYGLFPPGIAEFILRIKVPYNVNVAALVAVEESLKDTEYLMASVKKILAERDRLFAELKSISWLRPYPTRANFILCDVLEGDARTLHQRLQSRGVLVRYFDQPRLKNSIRVSVGKPEQTDALMKALHEIGGR
jgi:histidinol-phosphate aminotransferase